MNVRQFVPCLSRQLLYTGFPHVWRPACLQPVSRVKG